MTTAATSGPAGTATPGAASATTSGARPTNPSPVLRRRTLEFHPLTVTAINKLTTDSVEIIFAVPDELAGEYDYLPGQHIAVRARHDGAEIRRSYSLCAPVGGGELHIAV